MVEIKFKSGPVGKELFYVGLGVTSACIAVVFNTLLNTCISFFSCLLTYTLVGFLMIIIGMFIAKKEGRTLFNK